MIGQGTKIDRRTVLTGAGVAALVPVAANAYTGDERLADDVSAALARFRSSIPSNFDRDYVDMPSSPSFYRPSIRERPTLPMIDAPLTRIRPSVRPLGIDPGGLEADAGGRRYRLPSGAGKPRRKQSSQEDLFLRGHAGPVWPDVSVEGRRVLRPASRPEVRRKAVHAALSRLLFRYLLGSPSRCERRRDPGRGPADRRKLQHRSRLSEPDAADRLRKLHEGAGAARSAEGLDRRKGHGFESGRTPDPEKTIAWYWLKNAGNGEHFSRKDIVFECFHNFVALSQWGNTIFGIMSRLSRYGGDADVRASFIKTMSGDPTTRSGAPFTPLELFVMELFRTISPNGGSISAVEDARRVVLTAHLRTRRWTPALSDTATWPRRILRPASTPFTGEPAAVRPRSLSDRARPAARSTKPNASRSVLPGVPSTVRPSMSPTVGRRTLPTAGSAPSSASLTASRCLSVDYAGFAPFGFGYRRCPGEQLTIQVFEDFLRKVWKDKIEFVKLDLPIPARFRSARPPSLSTISDSPEAPEGSLRFALVQQDEWRPERSNYRRPTSQSNI